MRNKKKMLLFAAVAAAAVMAAGCQKAATETAAATTAAETTAAEDEENYNTGDASMDNTRNEDGIGEDELLVVSFGTSFNDNRRLTVGAIENAMEAAFPDYSVRRGFTSQIIIDHVKRRDNVAIDNVGEALDRAVKNGVKRLVVQPTHLMNGLEYNDVVNEVAEYSDAFEEIAIGEPLLTSDEDFKAVIETITADTKKYDDGETAICFMGHGTEAESNQVYAKMQKMLADAGYKNYYIGTVEAAPTVEDVLKSVQAGSYKKVVLQPLMIVAGDHANNDMAGDEEDTWKSIFEKAGYAVTCELRGLGELEPIQKLFVAHARAAAEKMASGDEKAGVAGADETVSQAKVVTEEMVPVYGSAVKDGVYTVAVDSSSSMFPITDCALAVKDGSMTAVMTMGGKGYLKLFMGTGEEAAKAPEDAMIPFRENQEGAHTFTVPVEALDKGIDCAAFSKNKEKWYDRVLVFRADSLPAEAFAEGTIKTAGDLGLSDGSYTAKVALEGGSGRAKIESPAQLTVEDGTLFAVITWGSSNYDSMRVGEETFAPLNAEGNSSFRIPVEGFDRKLPVFATTTAMSTPHEIAYTLTFDSQTVKKEK